MCQAALPAQSTAPGREPLTTATQAVIFYTVPDAAAACTLDVRESGSATPVHDVNPALFANSHLDSRPGNAVLGRLRAVVIGKRIAETALDGRRYSRALQAATEHQYTVTCGAAAPLAGKFRTTNIVLGNTYMEGIPGDPAEPGAVAWPSLHWSDRTQKIIDPQTGLLLQRLTTANDTASIFNYTFQEASGSGAWADTGNLLTDDSAAASFSGPNRDFLYLKFYNGTGSSYGLWPPYLSQLQVNLNAWCEGGDCATATEDDRSLEMCMTLDGISCAGNPIQILLQNCESGCTGAGYRLSAGDDLIDRQSLMPSWFGGQDAYAKSLIRPFDTRRRTGTVNRDGNLVTLVSGDRFSENWRPGTQIRINGQTYTLATLQTDRRMLLSDAPEGTETSVSYEAAAFGVLIRKKTVSETPLRIQYASLRALVGDQGGYWDSAGSFDMFANCSDVAVAGPGGEMGWHCQISGIMYWIGKDSGKANALSRTQVAGKSGVDGYPTAGCEGFWDKSNGNRYYCLMVSPFSNESVVVRLEYNGNNEPVDLSYAYELMVECGSPPCWIVTNLTKASEGKSLNQLVAAKDPVSFPSFRHLGFRLLTLMGSTKQRLLLRAFPESVTNDVMGYFAIFNAGTSTVDAAGPSWKYWPIRWSALHGHTELGDSNVVYWPTTMYRGPHTGTDPYRGHGPYTARIASGAVGTAGQACPARPGDSLIPEAEWPGGNQCLEITVDGEPGDPTPKVYNAGTITTSGSTVTGTGVNWPTISNGYKMKIGADFFVFTRTAETTGTLSPEPPAVTDSAYTLFLEDVDNPKTGPNRRENVYLQDAEPRDVLCITNNPVFGFGGCGDFNQAEYFRVLLKNGNTWTLERGYNKNGTPKPYKTANANAHVVMMPPSCDFLVYPCGITQAYWDIEADPLSLGPGIVMPAPGVSNGYGHNFTRNKVEVYAGAQYKCPVYDGDGYSCYNVRTGTSTLDLVQSAKNHLVTGQPLFAGKLGVGSPNIVESHPSPEGTLTRAQNPGLMGWFLDGRPMLGSGGITGSSGNPAVEVEPGLHRLTSAQVPKMHRRILPPFASCGVKPMVDASGPTSLMTGTAVDRYKFCVADRNGECHPTALAGDVYFNCPLMSTPYCAYANDTDVRDVCIGGHSSYTSSVIQAGYEKQNLTGAYGRPLTKGLSWYRLVDYFWNAKSLPDGKWALIRTNYAQGFSHQNLMAKLPPFEQVDSVNRADYIPTTVRIPASGNAAAETHAVVEFGYDTNLFCTSRAEKCVKGAAAGYAYEYENVAGVACAAGCEIQIPAISQRVLYYRVVRKNGSGQRLVEGPLQIAVTP